MSNSFFLKQVFRSISRWISILLLVGSASSAYAQASDPGRFNASIEFGGSSLVQSNLSSVLRISGYRSLDCSTDNITSNCPLLSVANAEVGAPNLQFGFGYRWSPRLGIQVAFSLARVTSATYGNVDSSNPEIDQLIVRNSVASSDALVAFKLLPYPRKKSKGLELLVCGGISMLDMEEKLMVEVPLDSIRSSSSSFNSKSLGFNALFAFESRFYFNHSVYVNPLKLRWSLPVIRPSFKEVDFDNGVNHRFLLGRNYDLAGFSLSIGAGICF